MKINEQWVNIFSKSQLIVFYVQLG